HNYKNSLEAGRLSQVQNLAAFKADKIETYFAGLKTDIEIAQSFYNIKKNLPVLTRLAHEPANPEAAAAKKMLDEQLQQMQSVSVSGLSDILLVSPEGKIVYSSNPEHYPKHFSNPLSDSHKKAFEEGRKAICFSDVFFNEAQDDRVEILITAPAFDFNGAFIGVIAFEVDTASIYKILQDVTGLGNTGEVLIGKKVGNQVVYLNPLKHDPNAVLRRKINIGDEAGGPIQEAVQGKNGAGQLTDYRGKKVIAAWRYIPSLDWGMVAKIDAKEAFADVTNLRNLIAIILFIIIVLSGVMAFSIAQSISEPIKRLSEGAEIIGGGNLDYKIGINLKDEIGQLSRSFDKMTVDLKQTTASRDELSIEVRERKEAEEALQASEARYRRLFEAARDGILILDADSGQIVDVNPFIKDIIGYSHEELLKKCLWEIGIFKNIAASKESFLELQTKGYVRYEDMPLETKDGRCISVEFVSNVYLVDHKKVIQCNIRDITDRKKAENELRKSREDLNRA
ncbi:MAG: PAS domain S-box protein, partial [Phycisphaerae bacterium]